LRQIQTIAPAAPGGDLLRIGNFVARHRRNLLVRKVAGLCRKYAYWYANVSYDLNINGERFVLEALSTYRPSVIFDVGANVGDWTLAATTRCPTAVVYAFEIAQSTYNTLVDNTRRRGEVRCHNIGLSDRSGTVRIRHYPTAPALTTSSDYPHPFEFVEMDVPVTTGDAYAAANGVEHIDLLKIDVEGMEGHVLQGFRGMLSRKAIDLVQFEYGRVSILNRFLLRDFYSFFRELGYMTGKVFPNYVDFRAYDMADEDFLGPNYLACRADKPEYLKAFGGQRGGQ
jgi:FkbM family methyltransferase